jgi:hypothetical protein
MVQRSGSNGSAVGGMGGHSLLSVLKTEDNKI